MKNRKLVDDLLAKIDALLVDSPMQDLRTNMRALISAWFSSLDLVSREEFDAQVEVLRRTEEKLAMIQKKLEAIEEVANK